MTPPVVENFEICSELNSVRSGNFLKAHLCRLLFASTINMSEVEKPTKHWYLKFHWHHSHTSSTPHASVQHHPPSPKGKSTFIDFAQNIPTDVPYPPFLNVQGVPNFRDLGGYACNPPVAGDATDANHSIRKGYVYRCSELSQIMPKANTYMTDTLQIRTLFDLRSEREAANPRGQPKGVKCISTPVYRRQDINHTIAVQQLRWATAPDEPKHAGYSQGYVDWYRQIAVYGAKFAFRMIFEHIRDKPDEPFVFHCSAGKDRTGVLSALILKLCGVNDETVAWEYALTVPGMGIWETAVEQEMVGDSMLPIRSHGGMTKEEAHRICGSRASNMRRWLEVVLEREFGGAAKYLKDYVDLSDGDVQKIREHLIVPEKATVKPVEVPGMEEHPQT